MTVKVCDALCGSGKTSAAIRMMNERTDCKFIFVTQYLTEVERIKTGCAGRGFVEPESGGDMKTTKLSSLHKLLARGANIATTHALFTSYTDETKKLIQDQGYVLVLDEVVDAISLPEITQGDMEILIKSGSVAEEGGQLVWVYEDYVKDLEGRFREEMLRARANNFFKYADQCYCWVIPPELFTCFEDVYILTYMFHAQPLRNFFEIYEIEYEIIGTRKCGFGYEFCKREEMNRVRELRDKIHVLEHSKLNSIGSRRSCLSMSWYLKAAGEDDTVELEQLKKNLTNLFRNIWQAKANEIMWTTFKVARERLASRGYGGSFVTYNKRASNEYASRKYLAYCVNNFPRPWEFNFYKERGSDMDSDGYALSILIQWIFRAAIRNNEEIWVYIPSARMRTLLLDWLDKLAEGRDLETIKYITPRKKYSKKASKKKKKSSKKSK